MVALAALLAAEPTLEAAELAALVTLVRPSDALLEAWAAVPFAAPAASAVDEALRMPERRTANLDWRSTARDAERDIVMWIEGVEMARGDGSMSALIVRGVGKLRDVTIFPRVRAPSLIGWIRGVSFNH